MNEETVSRIRSSFDVVAPRADALAELFYAKLFEIAPAVRPLFPPDMTVQKSMLLSMLSLVVKNADRIESMRYTLEQLGARHVGYGALPEHYPVVRDVLLNTLAEIAGDNWSDQIGHDWAEAINTIAGMMLDGALSRQNLGV